MAAFYIIGALIIIIVNFRHIGDAFGEIFSGGVQYALRRRRRYGIRYFKSHAFRCGARSIF